MEQSEILQDRPLISVIIPVYQVKPYLPDCVDSVQKQTYAPLEIILVDDGSTDGGGALCDTYAQTDSRIRVIHQKNGGLSAARNTGIDAARGEYISFIDSDDCVAPELLEALYRALTEAGAEMSSCSHLKVDSRGKSAARAMGATANRTLTREQAFDCLARWDGPLPVVSWAKLFQKAIFEELRFPKGKIHEDEFTIHQFIGKCNRVAVIRDALYYHMLRSDSITQVSFSEKRLDGTDALVERYQFFQNRNDPKHAREALQMAYHHLIHIFRHYDIRPYRQPTGQRVKRVSRLLFGAGDPRALKLVFTFWLSLLRPPKAQGRD
ncbi:MAG: glycosyltransferase family 2 protein [Eubacteriales bacterium]|nr:glycosyltransferase family 2 protein [Eubacteriales bacterium]